MIFHRINDAVIWRYNLLKQAFHPFIRPLQISEQEASGYVFCHCGEFGVEILEWMPYLKYLKEHLNFRLKVATREGGEVFYSFADEVMTLPLECFKYGPVMKSYRIARKYLKTSRIFYAVHRPLTTVDEYVSGFSVGGIEKKFNVYFTGDYVLENISPLDYSSLKQELPFHFNVPYIAIFNKSYTQGGRLKTVNYYNRKELILLRDFFLNAGYGVVYNHFPESKNNEDDEEQSIDTSGIFDGKNCFDMRPIYESNSDKAFWNRSQIALAYGAQMNFATQGGTSNIPAIARKPLYILMRHGFYNEHDVQRKIYQTPLEMFYEVPQMLDSLRERTPFAPRKNREEPSCPK